MAAGNDSTLISGSSRIISATTQVSSSQTPWVTTAAAVCTEHGPSQLLDLCEPSYLRNVSGPEAFLQQRPAIEAVHQKYLGLAHSSIKRLLMPSP